MLREYIFKKVDDDIANGESTIKDSEENYQRYCEDVLVIYNYLGYKLGK